jgi:SET domain-containing protein
MPNMHKLEVRESLIDGLGVFAREAILRGDKIGTYTGIEVDEDGKYVLWIMDLDGREIGVDGNNDLRFLNHSQEPNAEFDGEELFAIDHIPAGTEVTFHYGEYFEAWLKEHTEVQDDETEEHPV